MKTSVEVAVIEVIFLAVCIVSIYYLIPLVKDCILILAKCEHIKNTLINIYSQLNGSSVFKVINGTLIWVEP
ncbi:MAG: hypothetical protein DRN04_12210 [Thermoprotei archaeon]|nr:MAG: hypothetical protein DRN04_12210 [Thermoprotei archaeon]